MLYRFYRVTAVMLIAVSMLTTAPALVFGRSAAAVSFDDDKDKKKKEDKKKEDKDKSDGKEKLTKQERQYQEVKKYSYELHGKDEEFRMEVNESYRQKQREHVEYAFSINMRDRDDSQVTRTGDKLKVEDTLYDNPLVQDYINRVGQSLVPQSSTKLYAFKVTLNPIPEARSLSTGTIYISSGFLAMVDNEAQLSYVLAHEVAHIERDHWFEDAMVAQGMDRYNEKQEKKRAIFGAVAAAATAGVVGGLTKSGSNALMGGLFAFALTPTILKFFIRDATFSWDQMQEDEADRLALKYMLDRNYDPREAPKLYASLQEALQGDPRIGLGFIASPARLKERTQLLGGFVPVAKSSDPKRDPGKGFDVAQDSSKRVEKAEDAISGTLAKEIADKLAGGGLVGSSPDFEAVMAELKRDNGVRAFYYDMFRMARMNFEESLRIRSNDPLAHLYYGKVMKLTARNASEKSRALAEFVRAIELDKRQVLPDARLHRALALMEAKDPALTKDIVSNLKEYVELFQREHAGGLPPNMDVIYDYMQESGEMNWAASPAINVSTKNIAPITTSDSKEPPQKPATSGRRQ
jgi:Zn-dependent protease with chaperone function